jgi:hypothetical protein
MCVACGGGGGLNPPFRALLRTENATKQREALVYGVPCWSAGSACPKAQVLNPDVYGVRALALICLCSVPIRQLQPTRVFTYGASRQSTAEGPRKRDPVTPDGN